MTTPHLASNEDEQELVRARGATITAPGGPGESHRVDGLIEVTRALGDVWIKDKISCHPDVYSFDVAPEHKLLILATDGLWDTVNATQAVRSRLFSHSTLFVLKSHASNITLKISATSSSVTQIHVRTRMEKCIEGVVYSILRIVCAESISLLAQGNP